MSLYGRLFVLFLNHTHYTKCLISKDSYHTMHIDTLVTCRYRYIGHDGKELQGVYLRLKPK